MIASVGQSVSALNAYQKKLNVTANNIANVNTDEFKASRTVLMEGKSGGVTAHVDKVDTPGVPKKVIQGDTTTNVESSNVDLAQELTDLIPTRIAYAANTKALKAQEDMLGALLDVMG